MRRNATAINDRPLIIQLHHVELDFFAIEIIGAAISDTTTGRIPLKMRKTIGLSWKLLNIMAIANIIKNEGNTDPMVAAMLPFTPRILYPVKIDTFTANMPGADWARAMMSGSSFSSIQWRLSNSSFIIGIMAYPPPIVKAPIFMKTENRLHSDTVCSFFSEISIIFSKINDVEAV